MIFSSAFLRLFFEIESGHDRLSFVKYFLKNFGSRLTGGFFIYGGDGKL